MDSACGRTAREKPGMPERDGERRKCGVIRPAAMDDLPELLALLLLDGGLLLLDHLHFLVVLHHLREIIVRTQIGDSVFL